MVPQLNNKPALWKWAIVAADNGVQGAIVCALHDSIGISVLEEKSKRAVLKWHDGTKAEYPPTRLADFLTLVRWFCRDNPSVKATVGQIQDIRRLHRHFRNGFQHFKPESWSIEKAGLPRIVGTALDFIELAMQNDKVTPRLTGNKTRRLGDNLSAARKGLAEIR